MRRIWSLFIASCLSLAAVGVFGQDVQTKGMIGGTVTDPAGAAVPGAKIVVTGQTGERTGLTNEGGIFRIDNLEPGTYTVRVEQTGFKSAVVNNVTVNVGRESTLNLKLETGEITATDDRAPSRLLAARLTKPASTSSANYSMKKTTTSAPTSEVMYLACATSYSSSVHSTRLFDERLLPEFAQINLTSQPETNQSSTPDCLPSGANSRAAIARTITPENSIGY